MMESLGERVEARYGAYLDWVAGILEAGMREGKLRRMDPQTMAQALVGMLNTSLFAWTADHLENASLATWAAHVTELFLHGASSREPRAPVRLWPGAG